MTRLSRLVTAILLGLAAVPDPASAQAFSPDSIHAPTKLLEFTATEGTWVSVDVSPDGRSIVFDLLGHVYEMPVAGGDARALTRGRSYNHLPRYSPDGTKVLFTSDRSGKEEIWVLIRGTDSVEKVSKMENRAVQGSWSRDGRSVYVTAMDLGARFSGHRIDLYGSKTDLVRNGVFGAPSRFTEDPRGEKVYYSEPGLAPLYTGGFRIRSYDLARGETATYLERTGGAADPAISPDGHWMVYIHRDDRATVLVLHDMRTRQERVLVPNLDRDRMESGAGTTFGIYPIVSWTPNSQEVVASWGGKIHAVSVATGTAREIPFRAPVSRLLAQTIKFPVPLPAEGKVRTRSHRWGQRTDQGVLYEALGDIFLAAGDQRTNLTNSTTLETGPVYDPASKTVYYASWSDDSLGQVYSLPIGPGARRTPVRLSSKPAQYGSLTLSKDGKALAYLRGSDDMNRGQNLEDQSQFDLVLVGADRAERVVTQVNWNPGYELAARRPPSIAFAPDGKSLYITEMLKDTLVLEQIGLDGREKRALEQFPHAVRAVISPDLKWIAFREYLRSYVTPFAFAGKPVVVTAFDKQGAVYRVDSEDGEYLEWSPDGAGLSWTRGQYFYEKPLADVLANRSSARKTDLSIAYDVAVPQGTIALTHARVITMDAGKRVIENATVIVRQNRIEAVGANLAVPAGARVFDLQGKTVMPGMIDSHAHYNPDVSTLNVIEQNHAGLIANLAFGVTTMYEVYGNHVKDFLVSDLQRKGAITGSRLLSVGPPIYGLRSYRPKLYRPILSQADADEVVGFNKAYGATALKDYVQFNRSARIQMYDAARRMGVNVVAESAVDFQMDWTMLMDGVSGIEHTVGLTPLYDDVLRLWAATGAGNTPTLIVVYNGPQGETAFHQAERLWEDPKLLHFFSKDYLIRFRRPTHYFADDIYAETMARELKKLAAAGVSIQVSGHGQMHGLDKHWEMELMTRGGMTPAEVLQIATINSARYLGLDQQLGSLEAGKLADLVIFDANPLDDIRNTRKIGMVMQNGVLYRGEDAARVYPNPEPAPKHYFFRGSPTGIADAYDGAVP